MERDYQEEAIDAVKVYLINLLDKKEYYQARQVGNALDILLAMVRPMPIGAGSANTPSTNCR